MVNFSQIRGFIVDNDDTAHDNAELQWLAAFNAIFASLALPPLLDTDPVRQSMKGIDIRDVHRTQVEKLGLPLKYDVWRSVLDPLLLALAPLSAVAVGFERFVVELEHRGIACGIASSAVATVLNKKWERFPGLRQRMQCFVAGDDFRVTRSKPAPDLLITAATDLEIPTDQCAYIGDSRSDVKAALGAGMLPIFFNRSASAPTDLPAGVMIVSSFDELTQML